MTSLLWEDSRGLFVIITLGLEFFIYEGLCSIALNKFNKFLSYSLIFFKS